MKRMRSGKRQRRGVEVVEVALTLPLLALALFGMIEITHRWHLEKMLRMATHEAMKAGAAPDGTAAEAVAVFEQHTQALGIQGATLALNPDGNAFDNAPSNRQLQMIGSAPAILNRVGTPGILHSNRDLSGGTLTYWKESL